MELTIRPITLRLDSAWTLLGNRAAFNDDEYRQYVSTLRSLLEQQRAFGRIVSERATGRVRVFGITTFVEEAMVDALPPAALCICWQAVGLDPGAILNEEAIGRRNARAGAQAVVIPHGYDATDTPPHGFEWVLGTGMQAFMDTCRGFNLARLVFGEVGAAAVEDGGAFRVVGRYTESHPGGAVHTGVFSLTREDALATRNLLLPIFLYTPPVVRFTPSEQQLIRAALDGRTDVELSRSLRLAMTAIKARWNRIRMRFFTRLPDVDRRALPATGGARGEQARHIILEYVRKNPCELTPYAE
jgi:hypothetical protein